MIEGLIEWYSGYFEKIHDRQADNKFFSLYTVILEDEEEEERIIIIIIYYLL